MEAVTPETVSRLQNIIEFPRNQREEVLSHILNEMPKERFDEIVNEHLGKVTPSAVNAYGTACFSRIDKRPNPPDGYVTIDEIAEGITSAPSAIEQAVLLFIWLHFEDIRVAHEDFQGIEKAFDYVLTRKDFEQYRG